MTEDRIFERLGEELRALRRQGLTDDASDLWSSRAADALKKFVEDDGEINRTALRNFRRNQLFINELPSYGSSVRDWVSGAGRGEKLYLRERYEVMRKLGDTALLEKHPISPFGNPYIYEYQGARFNKRWSNNLRFLSLAVRHLSEPASRRNCILADIGGGYGIFLQLMKSEFPSVRPVLVEFPEQLLLAYYYLQSVFPSANISRIEDAHGAKSIDRNFFERYDISLIPIDSFGKIAPGSLDIVSNFFSLGEMSEHWFDTYRNSASFSETPYLLTINRIFSKPTYGTDIDILRYRLHEYEARHFEESAYEQYYISGWKKIFYQRVQYTSRFFEFVGRRRDGI